MKFWRKIKPSKVLGGKMSKHSIQGAMVHIETVPTQVPGGKPGQTEPKDHLVLYATNSYCFVRIDLGVKDTSDEPGPIPREALVHMEKGVNVELGMDEIRAGITRYARVSGDFPNGDQKGRDFPDFEEVISKHWPRDPQAGNKLTIDVNPKLLLAAAEAIGEPEHVQITFDLRNAKEYPKQKRRWYSGALKIKPREKHRDHPAEVYLMPIKPIGHDDVDPTGGAFPY
jgi:hypothetical protein